MIVNAPREYWTKYCSERTPNHSPVASRVLTREHHKTNWMVVCGKKKRHEHRRKFGERDLTGNHKKGNHKYRKDGPIHFPTEQEIQFIQYRLDEIGYKTKDEDWDAPVFPLVEGVIPSRLPVSDKVDGLASNTVTPGIRSTGSVGVMKVGGWIRLWFGIRFIVTETNV